MTAINMSFLEHTPFEMSELFKNVNDQKTSEYIEIFNHFTKESEPSLEDAFRRYCVIVELGKKSKEHPFINALNNNNLSTIELFLDCVKNNFNPNCKGLYKRRAAHVIAEKGNSKVFRTFKDTLDWKTPDDFGNTPLHFAAKSNNIEVIQYLINCNVDLDVRNKAGITAAQMAEAEGRKNAVSLLLKSGATEIFD